MAIIYSYPSETNPQATDLIIGTSTVLTDGVEENVTRSYSIQTLTDYIKSLGGLGVQSIIFQAPLTGGTITLDGTVGIPQATTTADGYLTAVDWNIFNSKLGGGTGTQDAFTIWTSDSALGSAALTQPTGDTFIYANKNFAPLVNATWDLGSAALKFNNVYSTATVFSTNLNISGFMNVSNGNGTTGQILVSAGAGAVTWVDNDRGDITSITTGTPNQLALTNGTGPIPNLNITIAALTGAGNTALATGAQIITYLNAKGYVESVATGDSNTITVGGTNADPTISAVTSAVTTVSPNLATGAQISTYITALGHVETIATGDALTITIGGTATDRTVAANTAAITGAGTGALATGAQISAFVTALGKIDAITTGTATRLTVTEPTANTTNLDIPIAAVAAAATTLSSGGQIVTYVASQTVNDLSAPTSNFSMNSNKIINLGTPTAATDAATKAYVDSIPADGVQTLVSGNANTITIGGTASDPTVAANTAAVSNGSTNLATGDQIFDFIAAQNFGSVTSIGLTVPAAFAVTPATITTSGTFAISGVGSSSQVILGDGTLGALPVGTVTNVTSSNVNTISVSNGTSTPVIAAVTAAVNASSTNLATGTQIQTAIDTALSSALIFRGAYNASTNTPILDSRGTQIAISVGDTYVVSVAGTLYGEAVTAGETLIVQSAAGAGTGALTDWALIQENIGLATTSTAGIASFPAPFTVSAGAVTMGDADATTNGIGRVTNSDGSISVTYSGGNAVLTAAGSGTVSSVGYTSDIAAFAVGGQPITGSGVLTLNLNGGSAGQFLRQDGTWADSNGYSGWLLTGDSGTSANIVQGSTVQMIGGTGISTVSNGFNVSTSLDSTAVTAGTYTRADITVDAQGRLTAAANGSTGSLQPTISVITANTTGVKDFCYVLSGGSAITLTLPASPSVGDYLEFVNLTGLTTCTLGRNGEKIMNSSTDLTLDKLNVGFMLRYTGATLGWILI